MTGCTLALWQGAGVPGNLPATVAETARVTRLAADAGADVLVFPEGFLSGYHLPDLAPGGLTGIEDALIRVGAITAEAGMTLVMGTHLAQAGCLRNSAVVFGPSGTEHGRYHKRALFGGWEKATFAPGTEPLCFDAGGMRVGVAICYDVEFPELIRTYARDGAQLVVVPTALMAPHDRIARLVVPVRAMENQIFVGYANRTGQEAGMQFVGQSRICGPRGQILAEAGADQALIQARIDLAMLATERSENCYLDDLATMRSA
jgi:5-aminopentanamidase